MLVKLEVDQALRYWEPLRGLIMIAQPVHAGTDRESEVKLLEAVSLGALDIWAEMNEKGGIDAVVSTAFTSDVGTGNLSLLIYSLTAVGKLTAPQWTAGLETLRKYAASRGCKKIVAFSAHSGVIGLVQKLGGDTSLTLCTLEV